MTTRPWQPPHGTFGPLAAAVRGVERAAGLDRVAEAAQRALGALDAAPRLVGVLRGDALGHALHPLLTDVPLGAWMSATILDLTGHGGARPAARALIGTGLAAAVPTVASGLVEWRATSGRPRRVGVAHAAANTGAVALYCGSLAARRRGRGGAGIALALAGGALATAGGYLGGHLSLVHDIGSADPALREGASSS